MLNEIAIILKSGGVGFAETDTLIGLFCDGESEIGVHKIFEIKGRSHEKPFAVFVPNVESIHEVAFLNEEQERFCRQNLPGAFTVILRAKSHIKIDDRLIKNGKIGIRIPKTPELIDLSRLVKIAGTSANISGMMPISDINQKPFDVSFRLKTSSQKSGIPSTVIDLTTNEILRKT